jgi:uncharacterized membrane protein
MATLAVLKFDTPDRLLEGLKNAPSFEILSTNLSAEQEAQLKEAFAE